MYDIFAQHYDDLMDDVDYAPWARYLLGLMTAELGPFRHESPWRILDGACGTGNLSIPLAVAGCKVTGADISESMLAVAQQKARRAGKSIPFVRQALQELAMPRNMDCITCACDGVNYLTKEEDLAAFLHSAYANLRPEGVLLFDISSPYKLRERLDGRCFGEDRENLAYLWQNAMDEEKGLLQMDLTLFVKMDHKNAFVRHRETHFQRPYAVEQVLTAMAAAGFSQGRAYGFMTVEAPKEKDERIQFVAQKASI